MTPDNESKLYLSVAKGLVKLLSVLVAPGSALALTAAADSVEAALQSIIPSRLNQNRANAYITDLATRVVQSLTEVFESEAAKQTNTNPVIQELTLAIDRADFTIAQLAQHNYSAQYVEDTLRKNLAAPHLLDSVQQEILTSSIHRFATNYTAYMRVLPEALNENGILALERLSALHSSIDRIGERLSRIERETRKDEDSFERSYRNLVIQRLDRLSVPGAPYEAIQRQHPLTSAFVRLRSVEHLDSTFPVDEDVESGATVADDLLGSEPFASALSRSNRHLFVGPAGYGKTTLVQWLAVRAAGFQLGPEFGMGSGPLPIFVELRAYSPTTLPAIDELLDPIIGALKSTQPDSFIQHYAATRPVLLIVDGLDEIDENGDLSFISNWLLQLTEGLKYLYLILTTRPDSFQPCFAASLGLKVNWVLPMSHSEIREFVINWHEAILRSENYLDLAEVVYKQLAIDVSLSSLARIPLLCSMLCALNLQEGHLQVRSKLELYRSCIDLLCDRRDARKGLDTPIIGFDLSKKYTVLV